MEGTGRGKVRIVFCTVKRMSLGKRRRTLGKKGCLGKKGEERSSMDIRRGEGRLWKEARGKHVN